MGYTELTTSHKGAFKELIMEYCKRNLAKVGLYIPSPYVTKYILDEVRRIIPQDKCFILLVVRRPQLPGLCPMWVALWASAWGSPLSASWRS